MATRKKSKAAPTVPSLPDDLYVLFLDFPVLQYAVGIFATPEAAVEWAAEAGIPDTVDELEKHPALEKAYENHGYVFRDLGVKANRRCRGYCVGYYRKGILASWDNITPYRDFALQTEEYKVIDPRQTLIL